MQGEDDHPQKEEDEEENIGDLSVGDDASAEDSEEDVYETFRKEKAKLRGAQAKREFFSGIKFQLRMDSI